MVSLDTTTILGNINIFFCPSIIYLGHPHHHLTITHSMMTLRWIILMLVNNSIMIMTIRPVMMMSLVIMTMLMVTKMAMMIRTMMMKMTMMKMMMIIHDIISQ